MPAFSPRQAGSCLMSLKARLYIGLIIAVGTAVLGYGLYNWQAPHLDRFLWYLFPGIPAACLKVRLPGDIWHDVDVFCLPARGGCRPQSARGARHRRCLYNCAEFMARVVPA